MIYTLTLNPSIDYIVNVTSFEKGKVNRTDSDFKFVGGKGINVSKVLNNFNIKSIALGFIGGFTGEYIDKTLKTEGIETDFIYVAEDSRINVKLKSSEETEINGLGPKITKENLDSLMSKLELLKEGDILVLAGSIQNTLPRDLYLSIQEKVCSHNVKVVIDTSGKALTESLKNKPFLIKPNNHEIEEVFNVKIEDEQTLIHYGKKLLDMGAENVIISRAENGALLINKDGTFKGNCPKGIVVNSVGAGDSLVGGFLADYSTDGDIIKAFKTGIAAGSASAFSMELCRKCEVENLLKMINIEKL